MDGYGCHVRPDPGLYAFGSCTASTTTELGWLAAERAAVVLEEEGPDVLAASLRNRLRRLWELPEGVDLVFVPSGTDVELLALVLAQKHLDGPVCSVVVCDGETGSGTSLAASGRHFAGWAPLREGCPPGTAIPGLFSRVVELPCRNLRGEVIPEAQQRRAQEQVQEEARQRGERLLLHHVPCSKTGLCSVEPEGGMVIVDAAQGRCSPAALRGWLRKGWMVSVTGSKFWEAPPFCGVLLVPRTLPLELPPGLGAYLSRLDLPVHWEAENFPAANRGLLLRWAAGLEGGEAFTTLEEAAQVAALRHVADQVQRVFFSSPCRLLPDPGRQGPGPIDRRPSIFCLELPANISAVGARSLWRRLQTLRPGWHLGQPVRLGKSSRIVLRIAPGAHTLARLDQLGVQGRLEEGLWGLREVLHEELEG